MNFSREDEDIAETCFNIVMAFLPFSFFSGCWYGPTGFVKPWITYLSRQGFLWAWPGLVWSVDKVDVDYGDRFYLFFLYNLVFGVPWFGGTVYR